MSNFCVMGFCIERGEAEAAISQLMSDCDDFSHRSEAELYLFGFAGRDGGYSEDYRVYGLDVEDMRDNETLLGFRKCVLSSVKYEGITLEDIEWYLDGGWEG